jgi:hypothetical protein
MTSFAPADARVRALADEILAREHYAKYRWTPDFLWLVGWIGWLRETHFVLYIALVAALSLLTVALLWHLATALERAMRRPDGAGRAPSASDRPRWAEEAAALAATGRYLEAAHRLQLGTIDVLVRAGVLDLSRYEPNRVLRRRLDRADLPAADRVEIVALLGRFERAWFRDRTDDPSLYDAWRDMHRRVTLLVGTAA